MSAFVAILRNICRRAWEARGEYAIYALLLVAVAQIAIFVALPSQGRLRVAMIGGGRIDPFAGAPGVAVTFPDGVPDRTDIAMGRYDAVVETGADGTLSVLVARSPAVAHALADGRSVEASGAASPPAAARGAASTLMGVWVLFLLTVGVLCGRFYSQDKERGLLARIGHAPLGAGTYLAAHGLFTFLLCLLPALLTVWIEGAVRGDGLGLSLAAWLLVLSCTAALAASFSLLVDTLLPDQDRAVSVASMTTVLTSLLSGSFIAPQAQGRVLRAVSTLMPQRAIMEVTAGLEGGGSGIVAPLAVVLGAVVLFALAAYAITASRLRRGIW